MTKPLKIGVVAGEVSGDLLGADLISALKTMTDRPVELVGVGGDGLKAEGLISFFDHAELSIMGFTQVIQRLPQLLKRIRETADRLAAANPDLLLVIDSPDFTHRVAKRFRKVRPGTPVMKYVCPSVWAWKEHRAPAMRAFVDHVLALLPFEPAVMQRLEGPPTTFVGHRLTADANLLGVREARANRATIGAEKTILLLPGSRGSEVRRLLPLFRDVVDSLVERNGPVRFLLPTVPRMESTVREITEDWAIRPEISADPAFKWDAFGRADAALAASGTVILELGLAGVPAVSVYKTDWLIKLVTDRIKIWSGALPNLIADYVIVPEYFNEQIRAGSLVRWMERLSNDTPERAAMLEGFAEVWRRMDRPEPPGVTGARILLDLANKKPGHH
ncbi:lipid-A-disaccharide synthase [Gellertiella hungarica]|uniref:Lipid-A-disaccharide synthase n=1 Tax=Gellertiella hungarica TaxID=1572859 RepID=A0A7W6NKU8_9HYPH|nr:lipid-A-disaccharide synthase [Gellertiella hungarica]MBB4064914.1 lipid-A-disaccharide synthase [Gellertiella hungarica]